MKKRYPAIKPYLTHTLRVSELHTLHVEECGNPEGVPVVFLHGGPGAGYGPSHRQFFNPEVFRIVLFDQRGCGRSSPHAVLEENTTQHLVRDIELIRKHLGIDKWLVFGGSWGSTLALVYAQAHTDKVLGLILRGIFLCRDRDIQWFYQEGANHVFPDYWQDFLQIIPPDERDNMVAAYYRRLTGDDEVARMAAAKAWSVWEGRCASMRLDRDAVKHMGEPYAATSLARIECHYFMNQCFLEADQILKNAGRLKEVPGVIIHGRYDMVCPVEQAYTLHAAWPEAELKIIPDAGHSAFEASITEALVQATDKFARILS